MQQAKISRSGIKACWTFATFWKPTLQFAPTMQPLISLPHFVCCFIGTNVSSRTSSTQFSCKNYVGCLSSSIGGPPAAITHVICHYYKFPLGPVTSRHGYGQRRPSIQGLVQPLDPRQPARSRLKKMVPSQGDTSEPSPPVTGKIHNLKLPACCLPSGCKYIPLEMVF
jgi:hypothetical protein